MEFEVMFASNRCLHIQSGITLLGKGGGATSAHTPGAWMCNILGEGLHVHTWMCSILGGGAACAHRDVQSTRGRGCMCTQGCAVY